MSSPKKQFGAIPFRIQAGCVEVLLVTASHSGKWQFPKGMREPGLSKRESAEQEALEEAGVIGLAYPEAVGSYHHQKADGRLFEVVLFAMPVLDILDEADWEEGRLRRRQWVALDAAKYWISNKELRACIKGFRQWLKTQTLLMTCIDENAGNRKEWRGV